jgi:hypothetical protein
MLHKLTVLCLAAVLAVAAPAAAQVSACEDNGAEHQRWSMKNRRAPAAALASLVQPITIGPMVRGLLAVGIAVAASVVVTDTTDVRLRIVQSEFGAGFDSGGHTHPGPVSTCRRGHSRSIRGCEPILVHEGESYLEVPLVPVRAIAKGRIKWTTSQILPVGAPPQEPSVEPCQ